MSVVESKQVDPSVIQDPSHSLRVNSAKELSQGTVKDSSSAAQNDKRTASVLEDFKPSILAFACHWCTYSGADLAGLNRMNYPANVRLLRVPCSGRVNPQFVLAALNKGVDGVLVCGCHPGDCHYVSGNYFAKRRLMAFKRLLEYTGLAPERFQVRWISGSEAGKFRDTVTNVCEQIRALGPYVPDPALAALLAADADADAADPLTPEPSGDVDRGSSPVDDPVDVSDATDADAPPCHSRESGNPDPQGTEESVASRGGEAS